SQLNACSCHVNQIKKLKVRKSPAIVIALSEHRQLDRMTRRRRRKRDFVLASAVSLQATNFRDGVPIQKPMLQCCLHGPDNWAAPSGRNVVEYRLPRRFTVTAFNPPVRFGQGQVLDREAIMLYQRMLLQRRR